MVSSIFNLSQKTNENKSTWGIIVVKSNYFVCFLEELRIPKTSFEIKWPLRARPDLNENSWFSSLLIGSSDSFQIKEFVYLLLCTVNNNTLNCENFEKNWLKKFGETMWWARYSMQCSSFKKYVMRNKKFTSRDWTRSRQKKVSRIFFTITIEVKSLQSSMAQEVIIKERFARLFCLDNSPFFY